MSNLIVCNTTDTECPVESEKVLCCKCDIELWLSASGKSQDPEAEPICLRCARTIQGEIAQPSEDVLADCAKQIGRPIEEIRERLKGLIDISNGEYSPNDLFELFQQVQETTHGELPDDFIKATDPRMRDANGKLQVSLLFQEPGTSFPFFKHPPFETPEDLINDFDKPEELIAVRPGGVGGIFIMKKSHLKWLELREKVVDRVMKRYGLTQETLHEADWDVIMRMRLEIQREMVERN